MEREHIPKYAAGCDEDSIYYSARPPKRRGGLLKTIVVVLLGIALMSIFTPTEKPIIVKLEEIKENNTTVDYKIRIENPTLKTYLRHATYLYVEDKNGKLIESYQVGNGFMLWPYQKLEYSQTVKKPNVTGIVIAEITAKP